MFVLRWKPRGEGKMKHDLITLRADGSDKRRLTDAPAPASSDNPAWSADGKSILFDTQRRRRPEIFIMDADGGNQRALVSDLSIIPMRPS